MVTFYIPGREKNQIKHLLLDFNGTIAMDGILLDGIAASLRALTQTLDVHVVTSDTHGTVRSQLKDLPLTITILTSDDHTAEKARFVKKLGTESVIAIGNGYNDASMLLEAAIGMVVMQREGASAETLIQADIVFTDITHAFEAILNPQRLVASLRK